MIAEDEGDDEEADAEEDGDGSDDVDEVGDLFGNGSVAGVQPRGKSSNPVQLLLEMPNYSVQDYST